jgi:hypothetical protein
MSSPLTLAFLLLAGCPDPTGAPAADNTGEAVGAGADAKGAAEGGGDDPTLHTVDATVAPGEGVVVSGTISYEGEKTGKIRLDVLTARGNNPHMLAKTLELPAMGDWSLELPKDFGKVNIVGFLDQTGDGPTPDDPAMALPEPLVVGTEAVEGLTLVLSDDPDLGALTPGGPPPAEGGNPPQPGEGSPADKPIEGGPGSPGGPEGANPDGLPGESAPPPQGAEPQPEPPPQLDPSEPAPESAQP